MAPRSLGPVALYGQLITEDSANELPSHHMKLGGAELTGGLNGGSYRLHFEFADTKAWVYNSAYNHATYRGVMPSTTEC